MKRLLDIGLSLTGLLLLSPVLFGIAVLVRWRMGSPVLFRQHRAGKDGAPFELVKFRTMSNIVAGHEARSNDAERLTAFGKMLRSTSLDELPELWNVLRGDMSLVGPRPLFVDYLPLYTADQMRRHEVRPGITGWAQVNGRNNLQWEKRFNMDVWYVDNQTTLLDISILLRTVVSVCARRGITAEGEATMPRFTGTKVSLSQ